MTHLSSEAPYMFSSHPLYSPILHCHSYSLICLKFQYFFTLIFSYSPSVNFHPSSENVHKQCMKTQGSSSLPVVHNASMCACISHERWPNQSINTFDRHHILLTSLLGSFWSLPLSLHLLSNCLSNPTFNLPPYLFLSTCPRNMLLTLKPPNLLHNSSIFGVEILPF
jgi:hypothetical protein